MKIKISQQVIEKYPQINIGYLVAEVLIKKSDPHVEILKDKLTEELMNHGITKDNYASHPNIVGWRKIFQDMGTNHKTNCSSVEALIKRIVKGNKIWNISNIVDLYNCCSVLSLIPMGGYDLAKIKGDIVIRYGEKGDKFEPLGISKPIKIESKHIVYADEEEIICWLWNYRDAKKSVINESTKQVIFFIDSFDNSLKDNNTINFLLENLIKLGSTIKEYGILNQENPEISLKNLA